MLKNLAKRAQSLLVLVALAILLGVASETFFTTGNLINVLQQSSINALLGIGLTFVIISGGIDLSVGSVMALCGVVVADLLASGTPMPIAMGAGLALGAACGTINGLITTLGRIPPFIATLGMMLVARSAAKIYTNSTAITGLPESFRSLSSDVIGIPIAVIVVIVAYLIAHQILNRTKLGRYTYAIGGNEQAAWLSGVPTGMYKVAIYALAGVLAAVAAMLMASRLNSAGPLSGEMFELYAIAAAVIGGVSLMGGEGYIAGTLIGALIMGVLRNGLNLLNVPSAWEGVVVGAVLVAAVVIDRAQHRAKGGRTPIGWRRYRKAAILATTCLVLGGGAMMIRSSHSAAAKDATLTIGFVPKSIGSPFWVAMQLAAEKEAERHGARVITLAPERETDVEGQFQIVENLIEQKVDAILLAPVGSKQLLDAIRKANAANIPVLILDSDIDRDEARKRGVETITYIGSDNFLGGKLAGEFLAAKLNGRGQLGVIEGTAGQESTDQRNFGLLAALEEFPDIKVVASQTANSERARGYTVAQNMLQAHPDLNAIFAANDEMALGALEAVDAAGRLGKVHIVGFDAAPDAIKSIADNRLLGSVAQYPGEMGRIGVLQAVNLVAKGKQPPPVILAKVEMISADNVEAFANKKAATGGVRIGLVTHSKKNEYWTALVEAADKVAKTKKVELVWQAPERAYDVETQFEMVSQLVAEGVDGIILAPAGRRSMTMAVRVANQAGVPILIVDSNLDPITLSRVGAHVLGYIGSDNKAGGRLAGKYVAELLPDGGKVAILAGVPDVSSTRKRALGFREALASSENIEIVAAPTAYAQRGIAKTVVSSLLESYPDLAAIFTTNGLMALGAADALKEGNKPKVKVVAFDATTEVLAAITAGTIAATVAQKPGKMGEQAMSAILAAIESEDGGEPILLITPTNIVSPTSENDSP